MGRVQTDDEYKLLILLIYLSRTIERETIKNHMHRAGSHEIQIPTTRTKFIHGTAVSVYDVSSGFKVAMTETDWMLLMVDNSRWGTSRHAGRLYDTELGVKLVRFNW